MEWENARGKYELIVCDHVYDGARPDPRSFACEIDCTDCYEANQIRRQPIGAVVIEQPNKVRLFLGAWLRAQDGSRPDEVAWAGETIKQAALDSPY